MYAISYVCVYDAVLAVYEAVVDTVNGTYDDKIKCEGV